jgi:hypothetical protein
MIQRNHRLGAGPLVAADSLERVAGDRAWFIKQRLLGFMEDDIFQGTMARLDRREASLQTS